MLNSTSSYAKTLCQSLFEYFLITTVKRGCMAFWTPCILHIQHWEIKVVVKNRIWDSRKIIRYGVFWTQKMWFKKMSIRLQVFYIYEYITTVCNSGKETTWYISTKLSKNISTRPIWLHKKGFLNIF